MLGSLVQFHRCLVLANKRTRAAFKSSLAFAGQPFVTLQIFVAGEASTALGTGDSTVEGLLGWFGIGIAADSFYMAVERHVLAKDFPALGALQLVRCRTTLASCYLLARRFLEGVGAFWTVQQDQFRWTCKMKFAKKKKKILLWVLFKLFWRFDSTFF